MWSTSETLLVQDNSGIYGEAMDDSLSRQPGRKCCIRSGSKLSMEQMEACLSCLRGTHTHTKSRFLVSSQALSEQNLESLQIGSWVRRGRGEGTEWKLQQVARRWRLAFASWNPPAFSYFSVRKTTPGGLKLCFWVFLCMQVGFLSHSE